jgi:hypothetical protein
LPITCMQAAAVWFWNCSLVHKHKRRYEMPTNLQARHHTVAPAFC